ncbi:MAG: hypothetical protein DCC67_21100 [Planctomycetota bacterium]|nr:MAG: hypothetical protein DCC67_21100 [Planctomycetota bacterium]
MLPKGMVLEVERLLRERKLTQRAIAKLLGVSRGTVGNIARGRHPLHGRAGASCTADGQPLEEPLVLPTRCRGCGGLVYQPCLLCQARAYRARCEHLRRLCSSPRGRQPPRRRAA